jgi:hypothetical protein
LKYQVANKAINENFENNTFLGIDHGWYNNAQ